MNFGDHVQKKLGGTTKKFDHMQFLRSEIFQIMRNQEVIPLYTFHKEHSHSQSNIKVLDAVICRKY